VIAITLANCKKKTAKEFLGKFAPEAQPDLITRMASLKTLSGRVMSDLKNYIIQKISAAKAQGGEATTTVKKKTEISIDGMMDAVKLLKSLTRDQSMKLVEEVEKLDAEVGNIISKQMFTIEDLERANAAGIRELLRGVSNEDLKVALKNTPDTVKEKFFTNMSQRAALILKEDMEVMPPLKVEEIEAAQQNILKVAKDLMKEEKLVLEQAAEGEEE
jgi:flagellar motor switch protein FliG